jgi:hypothetical protein
VGGWRRLHNVEQYKGDKVRRMRCAEHVVARMGEMRNAYKILVGKPEGKWLLGRPRSR